jgi:hypothetical protein
MNIDTGRDFPTKIRSRWTNLQKDDPLTTQRQG